MIPTRRHRHVNQRDPHTEHLVGILVDAKPVVLPRRIPAFQLHDEFNPLGRARRRHTKQIADVDDTQSAEFHVMPGQLRTGPDENRVTAPPDFHRIVGNEPVAAFTFTGPSPESPALK